jgi:protein-S-isoprenylcysteine O-methyltransferase Ste14
MTNAAEKPRDHAGVAIPPPLIYLAFLLVGIGLQRYVPLPRLPIAIGRALGAVLIVSSLTLVGWSVRRFRVKGTSVVPVRPATALVIEGPYRLTRNPMYLGMLLLYTGAACWPGLVWPLLLAPLLIWVMTVAVIGREERYLARKFGGDYQRYQAQVRRWV